MSDQEIKKSKVKQKQFKTKKSSNKQKVVSTLFTPNKFSNRLD